MSSEKVDPASIQHIFDVSQYIGPRTVITQVVIMAVLSVRFGLNIYTFFYYLKRPPDHHYLCFQHLTPYEQGIDQ